jgi:aminoglycoside phosphotransferase (APT) family kinase protein
MKDAPSCLVHGDAHAGNLYLTADGRPGLVDWQLLNRGHWALDVAYHIGAVLTVADRERAERDLVRHYLDRLRSYGAAAPSWEEAWRDYRRALVYGYYLWSITRRVAEPITCEFATRLGLAVAANDSFASLESR